MLITALIGQKGGTGKTTTSLGLAVAAARAGQAAAIIDLDPQANAANWKDRREAPNPAVVSAQVSRLRQTLKTAREHGAEFVVIDTPGKSDSAAVEEVFVNTNAQSTLKLGQARGVCLLALARAGLPVSEYATRAVKKALVGTGGAEKAQIQAMLKVLLPGAKLAGADAADALAVAICHAHSRAEPGRLLAGGLG